MMDLSRLSLNQRSIHRWSLTEAIEGCARHGVGHIGVWRDKLAGQSTSDIRHRLRDAGVCVSSLCRGGFFSAPDASSRMAAVEDNRRAIEECAAIGSSTLVLVSGPARGQSLADARRTVSDGLAQLAPYADSHNVRLGIEPLHPMYAADRSVVVTLQQANDLVSALTHPSLGIVVDVFHVWWDPLVRVEMLRAGPHMLGFHVSDWLVPLPDVLLGRGLMGQGVIDIPLLRGVTEEADYQGPIEVEIFNQTLWDLPPDEALRLICASFLTHV
jgi:sugar phosphate isomerase/epimerase